jgi:hypothetical protein
LRTYDDYEILRHFALEGCNWQGDIESEATSFLLYGIVVWMRRCWNENRTAIRKVNMKNCQIGEGHLSLLLANIIES